MWQADIDAMNERTRAGVSRILRRANAHGVFGTWDEAVAVYWRCLELAVAESGSFHGVGYSASTRVLMGREVAKGNRDAIEYVKFLARQRAAMYRATGVLPLPR